MIVMGSGGESSAGASRLHNPLILIWKKLILGVGELFNRNMRGRPNPKP